MANRRFRGLKPLYAKKFFLCMHAYAEFFQAMPDIDTVPLPEGDLGVVKVKELLDPEWQILWREEKKKMEREVAFALPSYSDIALSKTIKTIEERLARIEKRIR